MGIRFWDIRNVDSKLCDDIANEIGLSKLAVHTLIGRGFDTSEKINTLFSNEHLISDPFELEDMDKAVNRIREAIENYEKIAVYGDYDCDGITATALLFSYLENVGADVTYYIPDRDNEGYGLNTGAIDSLAEREVTLIITVDNGVSAIDEVDYAKTLGIDVVITDHHKPREILPRAVAVLDPHRSDCASGLLNFAGVGVAFKLVCALEGDNGEEMLDYYSDLACIGTIADIISLTGESRTIVKHGLTRLADRIGINALIEECGFTADKVTSQEVSFGLVPRINAAGRLGNVESSLRLLLTDDEDEAKALASEINSYNVERKNIECKIIEDIERELSENPDIINQRLIIVAGDNWHHGVIGIVCSKIVEKYGKPCILISIEGNEARASGRSVEGFSLVEAIASCKDLLIRFGGHTMAAGLTLETNNIDRFMESILNYAKTNFSEMPNNRLVVDKSLTNADLNVKTIKSISVLEPFGAGNEYPIFALQGLIINDITAIGNGKHLRLRLTKDGNSIYAVYFGMTPQKFLYECGDTVDIAAIVDINYYNDEERLSIKVKDIRLSNLNQQKLFGGMRAYESYKRGEELSFDITLITPSREDIAAVYKYIKKNGGFACQYDVLYSRLVTKELNYCKLRIIVDILLELGLIEISQSEDASTIILGNIKDKIDINTSEILQSLIKKGSHS